MSDIIRLLPDNVANQIAAGEVVQRPSSVVKELLENAIDAGATRLKLLVKDAGRTVIQVLDNGSGMTATDARICFERHATSKIKSADDLFNIKTKGFRGEALASIAAVAQVEMKTRRKGDSLGSQIIIEGSEVKSQEPVSCPEGTTFIVKNLFYNIPARRNFLKSNQVELKHIIEEFERVALVHPEIHFELSHNQQELFNLPPGNFRQRIVALYGKSFNERLVPVEENTDIIRIRGFLIKPAFTKKTRGEQFFFVNDRFIRSNYLHHAVMSAHEGIIPKENFPGYFLYFDVDPKSIDINIHPTKTEIKFEDEKSIYAILHSAARRSLGMYNIVPSLDFETEQGITIPLPGKDQTYTAPVIRVNPDYNPFEAEKKSAASYSSFEKKEKTNSEELYATGSMISQKDETQNEMFIEPESEQVVNRQLFQTHGRFILCPVKTGIWVIDQQRAHQRILYEKFIQSLARQSGYTQQQLFPQVVELSPSDFVLIQELSVDLCHLGFDLSEMGNNSIAVNGTPAEAGDQNPQQLIETMLEEFKHFSNGVKQNRLDMLARSLASTLSIKPGTPMEQAEMVHLVDELFACESPFFSPSGKPTIVTFTLEELENRFG
jgi:DNA mismatch repair protein MutL